VCENQSNNIKRKVFKKLYASLLNKNHKLIGKSSKI
jgi:hypothetical protein